MMSVRRSVAPKYEPSSVEYEASNRLLASVAPRVPAPPKMMSSSPPISHPSGMIRQRRSAKTPTTTRMTPIPVWTVLAFSLRLLTSFR